MPRLLVLMTQRPRVLTLPAEDWMTWREPVLARLGLLAEPLSAELWPTQRALPVVLTEKNLREAAQAA